MSEKFIKYIEIYDYYKNKILSEEMKQNEKLPTEQEIGEKFQVSRHTVRQAISELEKNGLIYREKSKGAYVSKMESNDRIKNKMIIVITTYVSEYIFPYLIKGIEKVLSPSGYDIMLLSTNNEKDKERLQLKKVLEYDAVGAIIEPTTSALENVNKEYYKEIEQNKIPYVMINAAYDKEKQPYVTIDDNKGGYIATEYLIKLGHKLIAGLFKEDDIQGIERKNGYLRALEDNNLKVEDSIIGRYNTYEEDFYVDGFTKSILSREERPTAIVCYNDRVAMKVMMAAKKMGVNVPEELSVVGYDNDDTVAAALDCKITTVIHPKEALGAKAAEILLSLINKENSEKQYIFEPKIIIKDSTSAMK